MTEQAVTEQSGIRRINGVLPLLRKKKIIAGRLGKEDWDTFLCRDRFRPIRVASSR